VKRYKEIREDLAEGEKEDVDSTNDKTPKRKIGEVASKNPSDL